MGPRTAAAAAADVGEVPLPVLHPEVWSLWQSDPAAAVLVTRQALGCLPPAAGECDCAHAADFADEDYGVGAADAADGDGDGGCRGRCAAAGAVAASAAAAREMLRWTARARSLARQTAPYEVKEFSAAEVPAQELAGAATWPLVPGVAASAMPSWVSELASVGPLRPNLAAARRVVSRIEVVPCDVL
jgi:hypothetical protein